MVAPQFVQIRSGSVQANGVRSQYGCHAIALKHKSKLASGKYKLCGDRNYCIQEPLTATQHNCAYLQAASGHCKEPGVDLRGGLLGQLTCLALADVMISDL